MQNLGIVLPKIPLIGGKGSPETIGFLRAFGYFSRAGKVTRRRQDPPIQIPIFRLLPRRILQHGFPREHHRIIRVTREVYPLADADVFVRDHMAQHRAAPHDRPLK